MPNVGRPSKGCKNCRDRKVKCDQKRPSCTQCIRVQKECHGYRDELSMMFRNESDIVAQKAKMRYQELSKQKTQKSSRRKGFQTSESDSSKLSSVSPSYSLSVSDQWVVLRERSTTPNMTWEMVPSIEDQAIGFFFSNYVIAPTFVPRGQFDFLPELLSRPNAESILQSSITAAGLAGLANATKCPQIMKKALKEYISALSATNRALQCTQTATKDSTLLSVIMLGMYENVAFQSKASLNSWMEHVNGACALINLRGKDQLHSSIGLRIFQQFYGMVLLVASENRSAIPAGISELWEMGTQFGDYSVPGKQWTTRMVRFMRHAIELAQDKTSDPISIVAAATKLDKELDAIKAQVPNIWKYETIHLESPTNHVYGNVYHIYLDPWIAQMWNNLRSTRFYLHKTIRFQLIKGSEQWPPLFESSEVEPQIRASQQVIYAIASGICASVPQITGQIPFPDIPRSRTNMSTSCSNIFDPQDQKFKLHPPGTFLNPWRSTGMHHLIWPLYTVARSRFCSNDLRDWVIKQLHYLALKVGTRQAVVLADKLKQIQNTSTVSEVKGNPYTSLEL